jgi:hypothetical protein
MRPPDVRACVRECVCVCVCVRARARECVLCRYADLKLRLREAGLPTGGKKRKIVARLRALDAKEAARAQRKARPADAGAAGVGDGGAGDSSEISSESVLDPRFRAVYDDADYQLDPASEHFSLIKGRRCGPAGPGRCYGGATRMRKTAGNRQGLGVCGSKQSTFRSKEPNSISKTVKLAVKRARLR